jgi:hypothetical protein
MKTKQICIWSAFWKHGWILLKLGVHVSIEKGMIENENSVKNPPKNKFTIFIFTYFSTSGTKTWCAC